MSAEMGPQLPPPDRCPQCYCELGEWACWPSCEAEPAPCLTCVEENAALRWRADFPLEAARQDAYEADEVAQRAEELCYEDWRHYAAAAEAAWAYVDWLERGKP